MEVNNLETPPQLEGDVIDIFFKFFRINDHIYLFPETANDKRAFRLMLVSNRYLQSACRILKNTRLGINIPHLHTSKNVVLEFHGLCVFNCTNETANSIFSLLKPQLGSVYLAGDMGKQIDQNLIKNIVGIPKVTIQNKNLKDTSLDVILAMAPSLQKLECHPEYLSLIVNKKKLKLNHYFSNVYSSKTMPINLDIVLEHKIKGFHFRVDSNRDDAVFLYKFEDELKNQIDGFKLPVRTSFEEVAVTNYSEFSGHILPLQFYDRVPNLKRVFYSSCYSAKDNHIMCYCHIAKYLEKLLQMADEAISKAKNLERFILEVVFPRNLIENFHEKKWLEKLLKSSIFSDNPPLFTTCDKLDNDEDLNNPLFRSSCNNFGEYVIVYTSDKIKLFLRINFESERVDLSDDVEEGLEA